MHMLAIFVDHGIMAHNYTMMAKPMETLELYFPVIQGLITDIMSTDPKHGPMQICIYECPFDSVGVDYVGRILQ